MKLYSLTSLDLSIAASLVILLALLSFRLQLGMGWRILIAALRTTVQLLLIGLLLQWIFGAVHPGWIALIGFVMLMAAGREVMSRQAHRFVGWWSFGIGAMAMFVSSFAVTLITLLVILRDVSPWYTPQYAIPLLGMLLGNTMNGVAIGLDRLNSSVRMQRNIIETRLMLGETWSQAIASLRRESIRSGLIPIINAMAAAGIVSLPGMMTGQILAGSPHTKSLETLLLNGNSMTEAGVAALAAVGIANFSADSQQQWGDDREYLNYGDCE